MLNSHWLRGSRAQQKGQGAVEYALILVAVALAAVLALNATGTSVRDLFCQASSSMGGEGCSSNTCTLSFDDPAVLDSWSGRAVDRTLTVEDGNLCNTSSHFSYFEACGEDIGKGDFTANLSGINIERIGNNKHPGIDFMFRTDESANGYRFSYSAKANRVLFWKRFSTKWMLLSSARVPAEWGDEELNFQVKVVGDNFTAYRDGEEILQASDDGYTEGMFGWRNKPGSHSCIGEISIQQISQ